AIAGGKIDQYTEQTRDDHERGLHDQSTRVAGLPLHKQAARVELKTRRLLRDIDVDCRTGEKGDGDKCELLADDECRWHVRASIVQFQLIELHSIPPARSALPLKADLHKQAFFEALRNWLR